MKRKYAQPGQIFIQNCFASRKKYCIYNKKFCNFPHIWIETKCSSEFSQTFLSKIQEKALAGEITDRMALVQPRKIEWPIKNA